MPSSDQMPPRKQPILYCRVTPEQHREATARFRDLGTTQDVFVAEAVREKLERLKADSSALSPYAKLTPADRRRVDRYIELLRKSADDTDFRTAVDANFTLFERVVDR